MPDGRKEGGSGPGPGPKALVTSASLVQWPTDKFWTATPWHEPHVIDCILAEVLREIGTPHEHVCAACAIFPRQPRHVLLTKLILCSAAFPKGEQQHKTQVLETHRKGDCICANRNLSSDIPSDIFLPSRFQLQRPRAQTS